MTRRSYRRRTSGNIAAVSFVARASSQRPAVAASHPACAVLTHRWADSSASSSQVVQNTSERPLIYPTAPVIIGCTAKRSAATEAATTGDSVLSALDAVSSARRSLKRRALIARMNRSATLNMWRSTLVRWKPNGLGPQSALSTAYDTLMTGRARSWRTRPGRLSGATSEWFSPIRTWSS